MKLVLIIIILVILVIININKIIYLRKRIDRSKSVIDVYLKKRFDLIPNLVEVVKGYANYETKTLEEITALRTTFNNSLDNASLTKC